MSAFEILAVVEFFACLTALALWKHEQIRADEQQSRANVAWKTVERRDATIASMKGWRTRRGK